MYFTETMFNPEYINPLYFKQQQTQMTQYDFWQDQEVCKAAHAIKELCRAVKNMGCGTSESGFSCLPFGYGRRIRLGKLMYLRHMYAQPSGAATPRDS